MNYTAVNDGASREEWSETTLILAGRFTRPLLLICGAGSRATGDAHRYTRSKSCLVFKPGYEMGASVVNERGSLSALALGSSH
ncbi:MAG: hypothetical protein ACFFC7_20760 [Candidatus Hermodarchaeota archaeon]